MAYCKRTPLVSVGYNLLGKDLNVKHKKAARRKAASRRVPSVAAIYKPNFFSFLFLAPCTY